MSPLIGYLGALAVGIGVALLVTSLAGRRTRSAALSHLGGGTGSVDLHQARLSEGLWQRLGRPLMDRLSHLGWRISPGVRSEALRRKLDNAGMSTSVEALLAGKVVAIGAGLLAGVGWMAIDAPGGILSLVVGAGVGYAGPELLVHSRGQKRQQELGKELPEALDLLALSVQAGLGFEQALAEVAGEVHGPLGDELDRLLKEQQLGRSRRDALQSLHDRNDSEDLRTLVGALLHANRLGTPIGDALKMQARELRRRRRAVAREKAGKTPVKLLVPLVFGIFPAMFVIIIGPGALQVMEAMF